jgi:phosphatidylserine decarboxylase
MADSAPFSLRLLSLYPKKLGSSAVGGLARARLPEHLREQLLGKFAASYGANVAEAENPHRIREFLAFFTRRLKPGPRPQALKYRWESILARGRPVSRTARSSRAAFSRRSGMPHDRRAAARGSARGALHGGRFATLYLAPKDYHQHPRAAHGHVISVGRIEGELWPVNDASTAFTRGLYVRNRRAY